MDAISKAISSLERLKKEPPLETRLLNKSGNVFQMKLEMFLSKVKKGDATQDISVATALNQKIRKSSETLAELNPKLLTSYTGYMSAMRYDRKARFINAVSESLEDSKLLAQA